MKKLKKNLLSLLKKEKFLVDIFLFGSALKNKEKPNDVDLIALFRDKDYEQIESILYKIKKIGEALKIDIHMEPIIIDTLHSQKVYASILHEGFSIKNMKHLSEMLGFKSFILITYNLKDKKSSDKVRFSYALYGRKKGEGVLKSLNGEEVGRGSILVPVEKYEIIKEFLKQWDVKYSKERVTLFS